MRWFSLFCVLFMLVGCANNEPTTGTFRGYYTAGGGFEYQSFVPCDPSGTSINGYWVKDNDPAFSEGFSRVVPQRNNGKSHTVYVRFEGTLSPYKKNGYGHMNIYDHEIIVDKLLEMELANNQCQTK